MLQVSFSIILPALASALLALPASAAVYDCAGGMLHGNEKIQIDTEKKRAAYLDSHGEWTILETRLHVPNEYTGHKKSGGSVTIKFYEHGDPPFVSFEEPLDARLVRKAEPLCEKLN